MSEKQRLQISNEDRIQTSCLLILTALAIAAAMKAFSAVLIPFVLAIFLTYCLTPVIELQQKRLKIPRPLAILTTVLIGCFLMFLVGLLISTAIDEISANRDDYQGQIAKIFASVTSSPLFARFGFADSDMTETLLKIPADTAKNIFTATANSIMSVLSNGLLVLIFMIFMITGKSTIPSAPGSVRFEIEGCIKRYTFTMLATSSVTGTLVGLVLSLIGVDFAWMFGFLAFLLNFIPNIGSIIATMLPIPVAILSPELSIAAKILAIVIPAVIQFVIGNIIQPKLMGQSLDLHPVAVLLSLIFFGALWGIIGMFLAAPITAVLRMLLEKFEYTRPIALLLAGRPSYTTQITK